MESNNKFNQWLLFNMIHIGLSLYAFVSYNVLFNKSPDIYIHFNSNFYLLYM